MGMYTEFFFRARLKPDTPAALIDWLDDLANNPDGDVEPYDDHPFFTLPRWDSALMGGGAVYQVSRALQFRPKRGDNWTAGDLVVHSSLKNYGGETDAFVEWISPHLAAWPGDFLGYTLYEDTRNDYDDNESPTLIFMPERDYSAA
jgi:hypothetical protein